MTVDVLISTLGWCAVINICMLVFASAMLAVGRRWPRRLHGNWFGLEDAFLSEAYFRFLANYKLLTLVFNVAPYFALQLANNN